MKNYRKNNCYVKKKYRLADLQPSFLRIDILLFCYYCLNIKKGDKVKVYDIWQNLSYYDYHHHANYDFFKIEIISLFPLYKNNHIRNKNFKISKILVDYWGRKFGIIYQQHTGIYTSFKSFEDGK